MELGGTGADVHPTGRMVMVSNSVLFQGALFKQIPGTAYSWHELVLQIAGAGATSAQRRKARCWRRSIPFIPPIATAWSRQQQKSSRELWPYPSPFPPRKRVCNWRETGIDLIVRYPVVLRRETGIDNQMAKKVVEVINADPASKPQWDLPPSGRLFKQ